VRSAGAAEGWRVQEQPGTLQYRLPGSSLPDPRNIAQMEDDGVEPPVRHQAFVNLNPLASLTCQGGIRRPAGSRGPRMRGGRAKGIHVLRAVGRCVVRT
jgi:hypothetical protein